MLKLFQVFNIRSLLQVQKFFCNSKNFLQLRFHKLCYFSDIRTNLRTWTDTDACIQYMYFHVHPVRYTTPMKLYVSGHRPHQFWELIREILYSRRIASGTAMAIQVFGKPAFYPGCGSQKLIVLLLSPCLRAFQSSYM